MFWEWYKNSRGVADSTIEKYKGAFANIHSKIDMPEIKGKNIIEVKDVELLKKILAEEEFRKFDKKGNAMYSTPIKMYIRYLVEEYQEISIVINKTEDNIYYEGNRIVISQNKYERNPKARSLCIAEHGYICSVCGFDFEETYGALGIDFIHVHHITPLSIKAENYEIDPVNDLIPVCPNCHSMIHRVLDNKEIKGDAIEYVINGMKDTL